MNKKGDQSGTWFAIIITLTSMLVLGVILVSFVNPTYREIFETGSIPPFIGETFDVVIALISPIVNAVYFLVVPADQPDNVRMAAIALFFLVTILGTKILEKFFNEPFLPLIISVIVGAIMSRSLSGTLLETSFLGASGLAVIVFLIASFVVLAVSKKVDEVTDNKLILIGANAFVGFIFFLLFWLWLDVWEFGLIYLLISSAIGFVDAFVPELRLRSGTQDARKAGETGKQMKKVLDAWLEISRETKRLEENEK